MAPKIIKSSNLLYESRVVKVKYCVHARIIVSSRTFCSKKIIPTSKLNFPLWHFYFYENSSEKMCKKPFYFSYKIRIQQFLIWSISDSFCKQNYFNPYLRVRMSKYLKSANHLNDRYTKVSQKHLLNTLERFNPSTPYNFLYVKIFSLKYNLHDMFQLVDQYIKEEWN